MMLRLSPKALFIWRNLEKWVDCKSVDVEIVDDNGRIFHVFQMRIGMNEFDHRILALLKAAMIKMYSLNRKSLQYDRCCEFSQIDR